MRIWLVTMMFLMAGCTTLDPYSGQQQTSQATKGAGIGAVGGAVVGAATASRSDRTRGAITGAIAGGAIGGGIGYYMDRQEMALRERLEGTGVRVAREGDQIRLIMPGSITFGVDRHEVRPEFYSTLESVAVVLKEYDQTTVRIEGHTDSTGSDSHNQVLSERRAQSVAQLLASHGVGQGRLFSVGYGKRFPAASNDTDAGRQANRRVEIHLAAIQ